MNARECEDDGRGLEDALDVEFLECVSGDVGDGLVPKCVSALLFAT